ncbi:hypothetical protein ABT115_26555 [Streptomyces sp. NPDC001832]|uniref:hypothetical protein n=1 Tax=Streptomyces sp. NPDC001832 TaxID=3154527 RepID=UPI003329D1C0
MEILVGLMRRSARILTTVVAVLVVGCGTERATVDDAARLLATPEASNPLR